LAGGIRCCPADRDSRRAMQLSQRLKAPEKRRGETLGFPMVVTNSEKN
jgi:hypothetical protein